MDLFLLFYAFISLIYLLLMRTVAGPRDSLYKDLLWCPFWPIVVFALICLIVYEVFMKAK